MYRFADDPVLVGIAEMALGVLIVLLSIGAFLALKKCHQKVTYNQEEMTENLGKLVQKLKK